MSSIDHYSIKITDPEELEIAKQWRDANQNLADEAALLNARHEQEKKDWLAKHQKTNRDFFRALTKSHLPDPDESFKTGEWFADIGYIHLHGDAYLIKANSPKPDSTELVVPTRRFEIN
jgi:hypothetical protein